MPPAFDSSTIAAAISTPATATTNAISSVVLKAAFVSVVRRRAGLRSVWPFVPRSSVRPEVRTALIGTPERFRVVEPDRLPDRREGDRGVQQQKRTRGVLGATLALSTP